MPSMLGFTDHEQIRRKKLIKLMYHMNKVSLAEVFDEIVDEKLKQFK